MAYIVPNVKTGSQPVFENCAIKTNIYVQGFISG
jgi:hypothetical protein